MLCALSAVAVTAECPSLQSDDVCSFGSASVRCLEQCPDPCSRVEYLPQLKTSFRLNDRNYSLLRLYFDPRVMVSSQLVCLLFVCWGLGFRARHQRGHFAPISQLASLFYCLLIVYWWPGQFVLSCWPCPWFNDPVALIYAVFSISAMGTEFEMWGI